METNMEPTEQIIDQLEGFIKAYRKAHDGDYASSLEVLRATVDFEAKDKLIDALESKDKHFIHTLFHDYKMRLGNALCDSCWAAIHGRQSR